MIRLLTWWQLRNVRRRARVQLAVLGAIQDGAQFYVDIASRTGWGPSTLYPALRELEQSGKVTCTLVEDTFSARCRYQIMLHIGTS